MNSGPRPGIDQLPVFDADGVGSGGPTPGTRMPAGRIAVLASVGVLVLLIAGIGLGGLPSGPLPSATPAATPAGSEAAVAATPVPADSARATTAVTPAVPCGSGAPSADTQVFLKAGNGAPVPGAHGLPRPGRIGFPFVVVGFGETVVVSVEAEICATSWDVHMELADGSTVGSDEAVANSADDPAVAAQHSWVVQPQGDRFLVARLRFPGLPEVVRSWHVIASPFRIPDAFFTGSDGRYLLGPDGARLKATARCPIFAPGGPAPTPAPLDGFGGSCQSPGVPADLGEPLIIKSFEPVQLRIPSWLIIAWSGVRADISVDGQMPDFARSPTSDLGGSSPDPPTLSASSSPTDPALFVLGSHAHGVLQFMVTATNGGATFSVTYWARADVR